VAKVQFTGTLDPIRYFLCCGTAGAVFCIGGTIALGSVDALPSFKLTYRKDSVGGLDG